MRHQPGICGLVAILKDEGGGINIYVAQQAPKVDAVLIGLRV